MQTCYTEIDGNVIPDKSHSTAEMEAIAVLEKLREAEQELEAVHEAFGLQRDPSSGAIGLIAAINQRLRDVEGEYNERCMQLESTIEEREQQWAKQLNHISELDAQLIEQTASSELEIKRLETELCGRQLRLDQLRAEYDRELTAVKQESELLRSAGSKSAEQFAAEMQQTINDIRLQHSAEIDSVKRELEQTKLTLNGCLEQLTDQLEMEQQLELLRTQLSQSIEDNQSQAGRWHQENSELRTKLSDLQESMHAIWIQIQAANPMHKPEFQLPSCATDIVDGRSFTEMFAAFFASVESKRKSYERHLDETLLRITHINDDNEQKQVRLKKEYESRIGQVQQSLQELLDEMQNTHQQALEKMRANFTAKLVSSEQQCEELQVQLDALKHQPNIVASDKLNKEYQELLNAFGKCFRTSLY
jgi:chromosome segregation ATPase